MCSVTAPPQNPLIGESTQLSFDPYGAVGGGSGACVWVKPAIAIIDTGGTHGTHGLSPCSLPDSIAFAKSRSLSAAER
jgi:hypothetical protein